MATNKSTSAPASDGVTHSTRADAIDHQDVVETKARQLRALLFCTYGNARESFAQMSDAIQDEYMWACADMAYDIVKSLEALGVEARAARGVAHHE